MSLKYGHLVGVVNGQLFPCSVLSNITMVPQGLPRVQKLKAFWGLMLTKHPQPSYCYNCLSLCIFVFYFFNTKVERVHEVTPASHHRNLTFQHLEFYLYLLIALRKCWLFCFLPFLVNFNGLKLVMRIPFLI